MNNGDWMFVVLVALVLGLLIGAWICEKVEGYRTKVLAGKLEDQTAIAAYYKERTRGLENDLVGKLRELGNAKEAREKYREFWADELQKRLDLAEKLSKYTGGAPSEGTEDTDAEVPAGD